MKVLFTNFIKITIFFCFFNGAIYAQTVDDSDNLRIYPYLQNVTTTSITIKWETIIPFPGTVEYGEDKNFKNKKNEDTPVKLHEIKLTNLRVATTYYYRVSYGETTLKPASFTTTPEPGTRNWRLVAYGDNRTYPETHRKIVNQIIQLNPSIIIHSGDLVSRGDEYEHWKEQYFDPMRGLAENITVFPCLGNHERNSNYYYDYMSLPDENEEVYYSFDYGNAHIIALNSNADDAPFGLGETQTQWLIKDLEENKDAEWKIVFFHHPLFRCSPTRGIEPQRWVWQEVFEKHGIDMVINGHDHYYQRTYAIGNYQGKPSRGVYHFISGGGGAPNYPVVPKIHVAYRRSVHHIILFDFQGDRVVGRSIDSDGNVFDAFVIDKQAENSPEEFISYEIFELERDITNAIFQLPLVDLKKDGAKINSTIEITNPFDHPMQMTFSWKHSAQWKTGAQKTEILQPYEPIKIDLIAEANAKDLFPVPGVTLHFQTPEGKSAFKNNTITFYPLKVWERKVVKPKKFRKAPHLDGKLSEKYWAKAFKAADFKDVQGDAKAPRYVEVLLGLKKNTLYMAAQINASPKIAAEGCTERDNKCILRDDHFQLHIGVGDTVYSYIVNPVGALGDGKNENPGWNSSAKVAAMAYADGWQLELAIPLNELNIEDDPLTINFVRNDKEGDTQSEYSLTFGKSGLDHRVPMYETDRGAVKQFAELKLK